MFRKVELPTIQSMKRPKSSVFPLFIHWLRMESVLLQNPIIIGLGLTLLYVALFGKSILLLCIIFVSFSIISIFLPLSDRFLWKDGTKDLVDVTFSWRELNQSGWWNSISADSIMQNMFQKIRWIRNRIHQVPEIVFFNILLLSEYLQECDNHFLKRVISHVSIISLLCILCNSMHFRHLYLVVQLLRVVHLPPFSTQSALLHILRMILNVLLDFVCYYGLHAFFRVGFASLGIYLLIYMGQWMQCTVPTVSYK